MCNPTFEEIQASKAYKGTGGATFPHPVEILSPILEKLDTLGEVRKEYKAILGSANINPDGSENIAYSHLMLKATIHENAEYRNKLIFVYRIDKQHETSVAFGPEVSACMNMCIFNATMKDTYDPFKYEWKRAYDFADNILDQQARWQKECQGRIDDLKSVVIQPDDIYELFGKMIHETQVRKNGIALDLNLLMAAYRRAKTPDMMWGMQEEVDWTAWDCYNCLTQGIGSMALHTQPDKSLAAYNLLTEFV